jgi:hypothetical protein
MKSARRQARMGDRGILPRAKVNRISGPLQPPCEAFRHHDADLTAPEGSSEDLRENIFHNRVAGYPQVSFISEACSGHFARSERIYRKIEEM